MMLRHQVVLVLTDIFLESAFYMDLCKWAIGNGCIQLRSCEFTTLLPDARPLHSSRSLSKMYFYLHKFLAFSVSITAFRFLEVCDCAGYWWHRSKELFWQYKGGLERYPDNWTDEQHSVGFPSCQLHLGWCCQGHNLKCRWHTSQQHPIYRRAPDYSWLSYIIIPSNLIVNRPGELGVIASSITALNFCWWRQVLKY